MDNYIIDSFDFEILLANVVVEETTENFVNDFCLENTKIENLTKRDACNCLSAAAKESFFNSSNSLYCQIDRLTLGSLQGSTLTNGFSFYFKQELLNNCQVELKPNVPKRCADDIFVKFRSIDYVKKFVDVVNRKHLNIRYTFDIEHRNSL